MKDIEEMRYKIEMAMATVCRFKEWEAERKGIEFKCTCEDPYTWSDAKVIEYYEGSEDEVSDE